MRYAFRRIFKEDPEYIAMCAAVVGHRRVFWHKGVLHCVCDVFGPFPRLQRFLAELKEVVLRRRTFDRLCYSREPYRPIVECGIGAVPVLKLKEGEDTAKAIEELIGKGAIE